VEGNFDPDLVDLLFTNKEKSGGGPIQGLDISPENEAAVITFEKKEGNPLYF
jgi:hypothetical protein